MMYAPFIEDSDDKLSQLAQLQIFLTLLSSLALRSTPPDAFVGSLVTVVLFLVPLIGESSAGLDPVPRRANALARSACWSCSAC